MGYRLELLFDPDFSVEKLQPAVREDGNADHHDMGYVRNVVEGEILARWAEEGQDDEASGDPRFVFEEKRFPAGEGVRVDEQEPGALKAAINGYVFWDGRAIHVRDRLNVRRDIDYATGDVHFIGDLVVHGSVRSSFSITGRNIRVNDLVEAARVKAQGAILARGGVKGGGEGRIEAGDSIKLKFCEQARIVAGENVIIDESSLHNQIFAGGGVKVSGRLAGGSILAGREVHVGEQLGGGLGAPTEIVLGYDPRLLLKTREADRQILAATKRLRQAREKRYAETGQLDGDSAQENQARQRIESLRRLRRKLWARVRPMPDLSRCKVVVRGRVRPGVEISIGSSFLQIDDFLENICFFLEDQEIRHAPMTSEENS